MSSSIKFQAEGMLQFCDLKKPRHDDRHDRYVYGARIMIPKTEKTLIQSIKNNFQKIIAANSDQAAVDLATVQTTRFIDGDKGKAAKYQANHGHWLLQTTSSTPPSMKLLVNGEALEDDGSGFTYGDQVALAVTLKYIEDYKKVYCGLNSILRLKKSEYDASDGESGKQEAMDRLIAKYSSKKEKKAPAPKKPGRKPKAVKTKEEPAQEGWGDENETTKEPAVVEEGWTNEKGDGSEEGTQLW